jgi:hypothetical protein
MCLRVRGYQSVKSSAPVPGWADANRRDRAPWTRLPGSAHIGLGGGPRSPSPRHIEHICHPHIDHARVGALRSRRSGGAAPTNQINDICGVHEPSRAPWRRGSLSGHGRGRCRQIWPCSSPTSTSAKPNGHMDVGAEGRLWQARIDERHRLKMARTQEHDSHVKVGWKVQRLTSSFLPFLFIRY